MKKILTLICFAPLLLGGCTISDFAEERIEDVSEFVDHTSDFFTDLGEGAQDVFEGIFAKVI